MDNFQGAETAIIEASQAAAQSAKQNVQNAYENATKISLKIDLKAPDIIIPINSKSNDAVMLDMGNIKITNKFIVHNVSGTSGTQALIDELSVKLTDMTMSRIDMKADKVISTLVEPISFVVVVKRNLSTAWYTAVADIDISMHATGIKVREFFF